MAFGEMIRSWRIQKTWTQRQLAQQVGCTDGFVAHLENEVKLPSLDISMALTRAFELSADDQENFLQAVEESRRQRSDQRIRTRGTAIRGALRTRGTRPAVSANLPDAERIQRELASNPVLLAAYLDLRAALADPQQRETVLAALKLFARSAQKNE
jgi:transcriptional regulator with XRE-family HTH domain